MDTVKLYHPELDRTIEVSEREAEVRRRSGWMDVDDNGIVVGIRADDKDEQKDATETGALTSEDSEIEGDEFEEGE